MAGAFPYTPVVKDNSRASPIYTSPTVDFFPPLTLVPCDSGRDNQLRVKIPNSGWVVQSFRFLRYMSSHGE